MADPANIQSARARLAASLDQASARFVEELARVWRRLDRELVRLVADAAEGSTTALIRAARAGRLRAEISDALERAGFSDLVQRATGPDLADVLTDVESLRLAAAVRAFGSADAVRLEALKALASTDVLAEGEHVAQLLWRATVQGVFSARPAAAIVADLADILDRTEPQVRTLYDTSISVFAREAEILGVPQDPDRPFVYTGPLDAVTRPFCRARVGKVFSRKAIDAMDNGQLPNVMLTGGGYNCRHGWTAVSRLSELAKLVDSEERVPEFSRGIREGGSRAA